jgi:GT2 family glycosyltransferase
MPKVAIIILGYNSTRHLDDCLRSLLALDYPREDYQIFFFDNASADDSVNYIQNKFPQVKVIVNEQNLGFAAGNNKAADYVLKLGFDYLMLINDDTISQPDFLGKLVEVAAKDEQIGAVQARLMLYNNKTKINSLGNQIHYLGFGFSLGANQEFKGSLEPWEITYGSGAALLIKRQVIAKIGLFAPDFFMYHEDLDFGWRLHLAGYKILIVPAAVIYHKYQFAKSIKQYYWMERNRFICLLENYKLGTLILIGPALLAMEIGLFLFSLKSGFWREKLKAYAWFLHAKNWQRISEARRAKRAIRVKGDGEVVKMFAGKIEYQEIDIWLLRKIVNPVFYWYWRLIRKLIIW